MNQRSIVLTNDVIYGYALNASWAVGGAERAQWLLARSLAAKGWDVKIGVRHRMEAGQSDVIDGVEFVGIGSGQVLKAWYRFLSKVKPAWWYWRGAEHWWGPAVESARLNGVKTIFAAAFDTDVTPRKALSRRKRWWPIYAWGLERADRILLQHRNQLENLAPRWQRKARLLAGTVEIPAAVTPHSQRDPHIAWVGVLREPKRPDLLIEFARRLPNVRFVVCGGVSTHRTEPGYSTRVLESLQSAPNIDYLGQVTPEKALEVIRDAAVLLSTSTMEGFPNVFLEAWAGGTPVVSAFLDPDDLIEKHGLGIAGKGVEETCRVLPDLLESVEWRKAAGDRARQYAVNHHSSAVVAAGLERAIAGDQEPRREADLCRS